MAKNLSKLLRRQLRYELAQARSKRVFGGYYRPVCAVCGETIEGGFDMHEAILTRRDIMGTDVEGLIMVPENCVLVHPGGSASPCHSAAHSDRSIPIKHLLYWNDYDAIMTWLTSLEEYFSTGIIQERKRLVTEVYNGSLQER